MCKQHRNRAAGRLHLFRWISLLLALVLTAELATPVAAAASRPGSSWAALAQLETQIEARLAAENEPLCEERLAAAYGQEIARMIRAVQSASDYVPGSLDRHGDFFFWETADGRANGYSPSLRAELRQGRPAEPVLSALPGAGEETTTGSRDVGVFVPYSGSYYFYVDRAISEGQELARSTGGALHVYTAENATVDTLAEALQTCGILLINSHGRTDYEVNGDHLSRANSSYICLPTDAGVTAEDQRVVTGRFGTYRHAFYAGPSEEFDEEYYCVDGTCIANHMQGSAPDSMVWLGFCLGMATEGMFTPLQAKGVEAMIGFSERVTTNADHAYRAAFVEALLQDGTVAEAAAAMKEAVGLHDPYDTGHAPAYPIAVSSQDPYPGRDHLTEGQDVCSDWKLHPAYAIDVTVEPEGSADVEIVRNRVVVTPHRGFAFDGWEITEGAGSAVRSGNELDFTLSGPCAVTLHMEARTPALLRFSAGPGQTAAEIREFIGDTVTLPAPAGDLEADAFVYHFLGWTAEAPETDTADCPPLLRAGDRLELTAPETVLHAVYGYFSPDDGVSRGQFRLLREEPADWAGDYVLTYQSQRALRADGWYTGQGIMSPAAAPSLAELGCFVDGEWLNEVPDSIVYSFLPGSGGTGPLKMKTREDYLTVPSSTILLSTGTDPGAAGAAWRMKWSEGRPLITNVRFPSRILQFSPTSSGFCTLTVLRGPLTLYVRVPGQHLYTVSPRSGQGADHGSCPGSIFRDMPARDHWAHDAIDWAVLQNVTTGVGDGDFLPGAVCTRAQIVTFLWRAAGRPEPRSADCPFVDLRPGLYYVRAALWAVEAEITTGTGADRFSPDAGCTREQAVTLLWRAAGCPEPASEGEIFSDVDPAGYSARAIRWAAENGITRGTGNGEFCPKALCTRAEIVTLLFRWMAAGTSSAVS